MESEGWGRREEERDVVEGVGSVGDVMVLG